MSTRLIIIGAVALIVVAAVIGWYASHSTPTLPVPAPETKTPSQRRINGDTFTKDPERPTPSPRIYESSDPIPQEAQEQLDQMNAFLDDREDDQARPIVRKLLRSPNSEVRAQAIFASRWIGKQTVPDLMEVLPDADEEGLRQLLDALTDMISEGVDGAEEGEDDYANERAQAEAVYKMLVEAASNPVATNEILEPHFNAFGPLPAFITLPIIERLITHKNPIVVAEAREAFRFNANGEEYNGPARTKQLVAELTPPRDE